jgi:hypothetical protein
MHLLVPYEVAPAPLGEMHVRFPPPGTGCSVCLLPSLMAPSEAEDNSKRSTFDTYSAAGGWLAAGVGQWIWARRVQRRGLGDNPFALPRRAFTVASLYVLGGAALVVAGLTCAGLTRVCYFPFHQF